MSRYAVTGSGGFIGRVLVQRLRGQGHEVLAWDLPDVDLQRPGPVAERLHTERPDAVIHLAASGVSHERANDQAVVEENLAMTGNLLDACPEGLPVVLAGSMSEYGMDGVLHEDAPCSPTTAYGQAKLAVTRMAMSRTGGTTPSIRIARLFGVYGPGESDNRLFPTLRRHLAEGTVVPLSDGLQSRDFIHVEDVCEGLLRLAELPPPDAPLLVNLGTGQPVSIREVACWMADGLGADRALLGFGMRQRSPGDSDLLVADTRRLESVLDWIPPQRLRPGVRPDILV